MPLPIRRRFSPLGAGMLSVLLILGVCDFFWLSRQLFSASRSFLAVWHCLYKPACFYKPTLYKPHSVDYISEPKLPTEAAKWAPFDENTLVWLWCGGEPKPIVGVPIPILVQIAKEGEADLSS